MAKRKLDGVVNAVHYNPDGQIAWVRAYLRRGPTFSDYVMLDRQTLIANLKSGKNYLVGERVPQMASTFEVGAALRIIEKDDRQIIVSGDKDDGSTAGRDHLEGAPVI
jgi:hypothetical protein